MTIIALLVAAALFVAYANGANDNFKGVATLYGSGIIGYKGALAWATLTTFSGSLCSVFISNRLVKAFTAKGLVPDVVAAAPEFLAAVALGAALTVFLATISGFPISTTHALTGGLVGAGFAVPGGSVNFYLLGKNFFLPLMASPLLAVALTGIGYPLFRCARRRTGTRMLRVRISNTGNLLNLATVPSIEGKMEITANCPERFQEHVLGVSSQSLMDAGHFISAGAMSFARGLNDAPKIVGLMLVIKALHVQTNLLLVAAAMAIGGLLHARKVAQTVSKRITHMNHTQGFAANLATTLLVLTASHSGLPVSTTHVSCGSLFGIGLTTGQADSHIIRQIVLSWMLTLPLAALLAAAASWVLH
jgi:PiT family inorganic phosphate transporter